MTLNIWARSEREAQRKALKIFLNEARRIVHNVHDDDYDEVYCYPRRKQDNKIKKKKMWFCDI